MASPGRAAWTLPWWPPVRENSPDVLRDSMQKVLDRNGDFADLLWFQKAADYFQVDYTRTCGRGETRGRMC